MIARLIGRAGYEVQKAEVPGTPRGSWVLIETDGPRYLSIDAHQPSQILDDICNQTGDCTPYTSEQHAYRLAKEQIGRSFPVPVDYFNDCPRFAP